MQNIVLAVVSFGFFPLLLWPGRFRKRVGIERRQFEELVNWLATEARYARATELAPLVAALRFRISLWAGPWIVTLISVVIVTVMLGPSPTDLLHGTWGFYLWNPTTKSRAVWAAWTGVLTLGALAHGLQVRWHAANVARLVRAMRDVWPALGVSPVDPVPTGWGVRPLWGFAGIALALAGGLWAVPMMWAGATQRHYLERSGWAMRVEIARRMWDVLARLHPQKIIARPIHFSRICLNIKCNERTPMESDHTTCPACGRAYERFTDRWS